MPIKTGQDHVKAAPAPLFQAVGQRRHQPAGLGPGLGQFLGQTVVSLHLELQVLFRMGVAPGQQRTVDGAEAAQALFPGDLVQPALGFVGRVLHHLLQLPLQVERVPGHHHRLRRQHLPQGLGLVVKFFQVTFDAGKMAPFLDVFPKLRVLAALAPAQGVFPGPGLQHHFAGRQHHQLLQAPQGPLGRRIEPADGLHFVAPKLQAHRLLIERRKQVDDAAPDAEIAPVLHHRPPGIAAVQQVLEKSLALQVLAGQHVGQHVPDPLGRRQLLAQGHGRGYHKEGICRGEGQISPGHPGAADLRVEAQLPEGQDLVPRKQEKARLGPGVRVRAAPRKKVRSFRKVSWPSPLGVTSRKGRASSRKRRASRKAPEAGVRPCKKTWRGSRAKAVKRFWDSTPVAKAECIR